MAKNSIKFIYNKYKSIFFYHILAFICVQIKNTYDKLKLKRMNKKKKVITFFLFKNKILYGKL